jgi:MYXO-CTERM domain-containing protein
MTPGTFTGTWGSGPTADSLELVIPNAAPAPAPEPSNMILAVTAFGAFGFGAWIRRRRATAAAV